MSLRSQGARRSIGGCVTDLDPRTYYSGFLDIFCQNNDVNVYDDGQIHLRYIYTFVRFYAFTRQ